MTPLDAKIAALVQARAQIAALLAQTATYKHTRYFHDCLPGCHPRSLEVDDHVPLPGNKRPTCRVLYRKHLRFMRAGAAHRERLFLAANRIGKTECAAYEVRAHTTGDYPHWWKGRRFDHATHWWAAGDTRQTTRDIIQQSLMGPHPNVKSGDWTGMLDKHLIEDVVRASGGIANCLDTIFVRRPRTDKVGGAPQISEIHFKSYDQGRRVFQGTERHGIWLDEEPPDGGEAAEAEAQGSSDIWTECLLRTMTTDGLVIATFTPLRGMTPFLTNFLQTAWMGLEDDEPDVDDDDVLDGGGGRDVAAKDHFMPGSSPEVAAE